MSLQNSIYAKLFPHLQPKDTVVPYLGNQNEYDETDNDVINDPPPTLPQGKSQMEKQVSSVNSEFNYQIPPPEKQFDPTPYLAKASANQSDEETPDFSFAAKSNDNLSSKTLSPLEVAQQNYTNAISAPKPKVAAWKNAVILAMQGANKLFNPNDKSEIKTVGELKKERLIKESAQNLGAVQQQEEWKTSQAQKKTQTENIYADNEQKKQDAADRRAYQQSVITQRQSESDNRRQDMKMKTVAGMFKSLPEYNPEDPRFASIAKSLGDVGLPITPKDAKKKVQMVQDAETGAWTLTLTDPISGQQEVRPVMSKDGAQLATTSTAKVMANAAGERQEKQITVDRERMGQQREQFMLNYQQKINQDKVNNGFKKADELTKLETAKANGQVDDETYKQMKQFLDNQ